MCFITAGWPVCFFQDEADWFLIAVTAISAIVSGVIGYLAHLNGKRAVEIAHNAELARKKELHDSRKERAEMAANQQAFDLSLRLDDAVAGLIRLISDYMESKYVQPAIALAQSAFGDSKEHPLRREAFAGFMTAAELILLRAKNEDRAVAEKFHRHLVWIEEKCLDSELETLVGLMREWRTGVYTGEQICELLSKTQKGPFHITDH